MINTIIKGHALDILQKLPNESVNCCVTSPPYWGLRDYGIEPVIWDGDKDCEHEWVEGKSAGDIRYRPGHNTSVGNNKNPDIWVRPSRIEFANRTVDEVCPVCNKKFEGKPGQKFCSIKCLNTLSNAERTAQGGLSNFCKICGAWRGSLGLEPTFELYIKHLCDIFDEVKRVLRKDGTCWVNIGDSYWGGGQGGADYGGKEIVPSSNFGHVAKGKNYLNKSLCDIPYRFSIEMTNRGWIKRNTIIWHKPNCMPSSAPDRFTIDFEYLFFFTKNNKTLFWTNEKTLECISKNPPGTKGIEGKDWEWRKCPNCQGTGQIIGKALKEGAAQIIIGNGIVNKNTKAFRTCPRCKGSGKVKYSFWSGHDYWFEQAFEASIDPESYTGRRPRHHRTMQEIDQKHDAMGGFKDITGRKYPNRNKRSVWTIPTQPFPEAHFAVYPEGLIEIPIKAGCPEFICKKCGKARVKIYQEIKKEPIEIYNGQAKKNYKLAKAQNPSDTKRRILESMRTEKKEIGYSDCGCNAGWESGIVLDPFIGSGTTAKETLKQRKRFIGIEIKQEYIDMSYKRIAKVQQRIF